MAGAAVPLPALDILAARYADDSGDEGCTGSLNNQRSGSEVVDTVPTPAAASTEDTAAIAAATAAASKVASSECEGGVPLNDEYESDEFDSEDEEEELYAALEWADEHEGTHCFCVRTCCAVYSVVASTHT